MSSNNIMEPNSSISRGKGVRKIPYKKITREFLEGMSSGNLAVMFCDPVDEGDGWNQRVLKAIADVEKVDKLMLHDCIRTGKFHDIGAKYNIKRLAMFTDLGTVTTSYIVRDLLANGWDVKRRLAHKMKTAK